MVRYTSFLTIQVDFYTNIGGMKNVKIFKTYLTNILLLV